MLALVASTIALAATTVCAAPTGLGMKLKMKRQSQSAPHFFYYWDYKDTSSGFLAPGNFSGWNNVGMGFWLSSTGAATDSASVWSGLTDAERTAFKSQYAAAGIKLIVSAFGSTEVPTTSGVDPTTVAGQIASFVTANQLDGVDIDYEDFNAMETAGGGGVQWLITLQNALRAQLPQGQYQISHAPIAPWFSSDTTSLPDGGYLAVDKAVGDSIDFYNLQYYSQGTSYTTCDALINTSDLNGYENTAIEQIVAAGVPASKLVLGKPGNTGDASSGYVDPTTLAGCVSQGKADGWNGGLMIWQYPDAPADYVSTVWGS